MGAVDMDGLIAAHGRDVYAFCHKMTGAKEDADDLYQQTFLKAMELRHKIDAGQNPKSFLLSIAVGIWKNSVRKEARRRRIAPEDAAQSENISRVMSGEPDILESMVASELRGEVGRIVSGLQEKFRLPIVMYYTVEMSIEEIAQALKVPKGTVKSRLYAARMRIKQELEVNGYGENDRRGFGCDSQSVPDGG